MSQREALTCVIDIQGNTRYRSRENTNEGEDEEKGSLRHFGGG